MLSQISSSRISIHSRIRSTWLRKMLSVRSSKKWLAWTSNSRSRARLSRGNTSKCSIVTGRSSESRTKSGLTYWVSSKICRSSLRRRVLRDHAQVITCTSRNHFQTPLICNNCQVWQSQTFKSALESFSFPTSLASILLFELSPMRCLPARIWAKLARLALTLHHSRTWPQITKTWLWKSTYLRQIASLTLINCQEKLSRFWPSSRWSWLQRFSPSMSSRVSKNLIRWISTISTWLRDRLLKVRKKRNRKLLRAEINRNRQLSYARLWLSSLSPSLTCNSQSTTISTNNEEVRPCLV